jgi:hypothetical protein
MAEIRVSHPHQRGQAKTSHASGAAASSGVTPRGLPVVSRPRPRGCLRGRGAWGFVGGAAQHALPADALGRALNNHNSS